MGSGLSAMPLCGLKGMLINIFNFLLFISLLLPIELLAQKDYALIYDSSYIFNIHSNLSPVIGKFTILKTKDENKRTNIYKISIFNFKDSSLSQEIVDTSDYSNFWPDIIFNDFNFDGYKDISLVTFRDVKAQALYDYWIYNPQTHLYELSDEFSGLLSCEVVLDSTSRTIISTCRDGCGGLCFTISVYKIDENHLVLIEETNAEQEITNDKWRIKVTTQKLIDGEMKITNVQYQDE